jgi:hypothetical protein
MTESDPTSYLAVLSRALEGSRAALAALRVSRYRLGGAAGL